MPQTKITGITDWLKRKGRKIGGSIVNPVVYIGKETAGTSTSRPRTFRTYLKTIIDVVCRVSRTIGSRSIWRMSMALSQQVSQYILYTLTLSIACLIFTCLILISLSYWALISVGHQLVRFFKGMRLAAGFVSMSFV